MAQSTRDVNISVGSDDITDGTQIQRVVVYAKDNTVSQKITDRMISLCTKDYFTNDLKYLVVRTVFNGNKQKFNKMMMNPEIIKMTMK